MKRKAMLIDKLYETHQGRGRQSIGIIGTHHGSGVTYTALMMAFYMGEERGIKTALLECNRHHDMSRIQNAYEWSHEEAYSFSFHQITCYKEVTQNNLSEILGESYETSILDFGTDFITNREEFLRCSTKIIIGGRSQWDQQKLSEFIQANAGIGGSETWLYLIPCADSRTINFLKGKLEQNIYSVPFEREPTMLSKNVVKLFEKLL